MYNENYRIENSTEMFQVIMMKNFLKLTTDTISQVSEPLKTPKKANSKMSTHRPIIFKLPKKSQEKVLKESH